MDSPEQEAAKDWCKRVAIYGVDMLVDHGLLKKEDLDRAAEIVLRRFSSASLCEITHRRELDLCDFWDQGSQTI